MQKRLDARHNLRMPLELKARLLRSTVDSGRSMNAEILARLEASFAPDPSALIMEALKPIASLSEDDRQKAGRLLQDLGAILATERLKP